MGLFILQFINLTMQYMMGIICGMKKLLLSLFVATAVIPGAFAYVNRPNAVITILDKTAGKNHTFSIPVGVDTKYEKLNFLVRTCKQNDPFQAENAFMFVEISQNNNLIFSGWMNKNEPGENPLQNADYDVWLVRCE